MTPRPTVTGQSGIVHSGLEEVPAGGQLSKSGGGSVGLFMRRISHPIAIKFKSMMDAPHKIETLEKTKFGKHTVVDFIRPALSPKSRAPRFIAI
jgi:hypothetical protein